MGAASDRKSLTPGRFDRDLELNIDLRPTDRVALELAKALVSLGAKLEAHLAHAGDIVKAVATVGGFLWQGRKSERAAAFLLGLFERLERTRFEYLKKDEAQDLFEEVLRRIAEQPDESRRQQMRQIFLTIIETPRTHVENRLLLRLADELPPDALRALALMPTALTDEEVRSRDDGSLILAGRLGCSQSEVLRLMRYLSNENLLDAEQFDVVPGFGAAGGSLTFLLTALGRTLIDYGRDSA